MQTFISIVVPVFNASPYMKDCLNSIINQTYGNFEVIIVDDGSTDSSLEICEAISKSDPRIKIIHQINSGVSAARKTGALNSTGEYILFVDADDTIYPNLLTELVPHTKNNYDIIQSGANIRKVCSGEYFVRQTMLGKSPASVCGKLFKRDLLNENILSIPRELNIGEDLLFNIRIGLIARTVYSVSDNYYTYNIHQGSTMSNRIVSQNYEEKYLLAVKESLGDNLEIFRNEYTYMQLASMENIIVCRQNLNRNKEWIREAVRNSKKLKLSRRKWIIRNIKHSTICRYLLAAERRLRIFSF